ncbi:Uncharacterised protein [Klebsiella pneumoniae]|nr:Uncharacterised protein [Klebsiella pneumoniae]
MTARLAEGVIKDLYSNGMGYNQMAFSAALSPTLVTYKAIEGDLQGIDHPDDQRIALLSASVCGIQTA